jgi:XTP/dITP diphosphohydrolase
MNRLVLASGNAGKLKELSEVLNPLGFELIPQGEFNLDSADETGLSFVENA